MVLVVKNPLANSGDRKDMGSIPGDPLEEGMATHSSIPAYRILWTGVHSQARLKWLSLKTRISLYSQSSGDMKSQTFVRKKTIRHNEERKILNYIQILKENLILWQQLIVCFHFVQVSLLLTLSCDNIALCFPFCNSVFYWSGGALIIWIPIVNLSLLSFLPV